MNILPKKRWHVRNRENIARVRRDEAAAAEEEKEKERRRRLAEQEVKLELMRKQTREKYNLPNEAEPVIVPSPSNKLEHVNFFKDIEEGAIITTAKNAEHEQEIKEEKEKYEKQIGYLTYLGQDTNEASGKVSWYNRPRSTLVNDEDGEYDLKKKSKLDPVCAFKRVFQRHDFSHLKNSIQKSETSPVAIKVKKHKKEKKRKHKYRKRKDSSSSDSSSSCDSHSKRLAKEKQLQILRQQRLKREREEKLRADRLLAKMRGDVIPEPIKEVPQFTQKYNSQFNPHLAKQNIAK